MWITGAEPKRIEQTLTYGFVTGYFATMVFDKPDWSFRGQNLSRRSGPSAGEDRARGRRGGPGFERFPRRGRQAPSIPRLERLRDPAPTSIDYYEEVAAKLGGIEKIQSFYRLFMAPGMQHCGLGLGPNAVGGVYGLPPPSRDPAHDVVAALAHWVEDGAPPEQIIATLYHDNNPTKEIAAQRPWCPYPATARFSGQARVPMPPAIPARRRRSAAEARRVRAARHAPLRR